MRAILQIRIRKPAYFLLASIAVSGAPATAQDELVGISPLRISSYGTLSISQDDDGRLSPIRDLTQSPKDGRKTLTDQANDTTWRMDSRLGVQLAYRFSPRLEGFSQFLLRDQVLDGVDSVTEIAHLGYVLSDDWKLRLGRIGYDAFMMSDHRNLGYAYPWVRPPRDFYGWIPLFFLDGADLTYGHQGEDASWRLRGQFGKSHAGVPMTPAVFDIQIESLWSVSLSREAGPWQFKAGLSNYAIGNEATNTPLEALRNGLEQIRAATAQTPLNAISDEAAMLRKELAFKDVHTNYATLGATYDDGDWLAQAELGYSESDSTIATASRMGYLAVGRHIGDFTPFIGYSASKPNSTLLTAMHDWSVIGQAATQASAYIAVNSTRVDQKTITVGVRWDLHPNMALKLQWDRSTIEPLGYMLWFRDFNLVPRETTVNLFTASLDFVF